MEGQEKHLYAFGRFRLDPREHLLTCEGKPVPLLPKAFDTLLVLVQNAGRLVEKDAMLRELWPDTFVEEGNLPKHISMLRKALGEFANGTEYIETVPKRGYRFVVEVTEVSDRSKETARTFGRNQGGSYADPADAREASASGLSPSEKSRLLSPRRPPAEYSRDAKNLRISGTEPSRESSQIAQRGMGVSPAGGRGQAGHTTASWWRAWLVAPVFVLGGLALVAVAAIVARQIVLQKPPPRAIRLSQITHSGRAWWAHAVLTDGVRLYFVERIGGRRALAWVPSAGGEPTPIPTPFANTILLDVSPDHTRFLLASAEGEEEEYPLWVMPITGGSPQRLGTLTASTAAWLPDGQRILFSRGFDLFVANKDGGEPQRVSSTSGKPWDFHWSPNGSVLRFTVEDTLSSTVSLWEGAADGTKAHRWLSPRGPPKAGWLVGECCGVWTPDGRYFVYRSSSGDSTGLWALRERTGLFSPFDDKPFPLHATSSKVDFFRPLASSDGKRIFFIGQHEKRELVRFDAGSQRFVPYLSFAKTKSASRGTSVAPLNNVNAGLLTH